MKLFDVRFEGKSRLGSGTGHGCCPEIYQAPTRKRTNDPPTEEKREPTDVQYAEHPQPQVSPSFLSTTTAIHCQ
eukprot:scaffold1001_cov169-Amphora_coffeaeformis.AAC.1